MSPRKPMPVRNVRVPDDLWQAAQSVAKAKEQNLSEEIRKFLERYVEGAKK